MAGLPGPCNALPYVDRPTHIESNLPLQIGCLPKLNAFTDGHNTHTLFAIRKGKVLEYVV
jgi:hypothetical protein